MFLICFLAFLNTGNDEKVTPKREKNYGKITDC